MKTALPLAALAALAPFIAPFSAPGSPQGEGALARPRAREVVQVVPLDRPKVGRLFRAQRGESFPSPVQRVLEELARRVEEQRPRGEGAAVARDGYSRINVPTPARPLLQLWIAPLPLVPTHHGILALFLHDAATGEVSQEPVLVDGHWLGERGLDPRLTDLDRDGTPEVVYRDFVHNGTVENIELDVFLRIGDELALSEVLRYPRSSVDVQSRGEAGVLRRRLVRSEGALALEGWRENPVHIPGIVRVPTVSLRRDAAGRWRAVGETLEGGAGRPPLARRRPADGSRPTGGR